MIETIKPDLIINAAAMTNVDACEDDQNLAYRINADAVGFIAKAARAIGAQLLHYSTDYVFDGSKEDGFLEDDCPNPISVYGASKLKGEVNALAGNPKTFIARVCWLFGENRNNFVDFIVDCALNDKPMKLIHDQYGHPSFTKDLAEGSLKSFVDQLSFRRSEASTMSFRRSRATEKSNHAVEAGQNTNVGAGQMLEQDCIPNVGAGLHPAPYGIYHLFNSGKTSRADQGKHIFTLLNTKPTVELVSVSEFPGKAPRPKYSILKNTKLPDLRTWQEAISEYVIK